MGNAPRVTAALAVLFLVLRCPGTAQTEGRERPTGTMAPLTLAQAGRDFLSAEGRIWSSPARIKTRDIAPLLAIGAAAAFLIAADERVRDSVQDYAGSHPWVGDVGTVVSHMGDLGAWATAGTFFGFGLLFKNERARDTGYLAACAMVHCVIVDTVVKGLSGRQRPSYEDGEDHWWGPVGFVKRTEEGLSDKYESFWSGHAANAFGLATVVARQYRHKAWVPYVAYAVAMGVGLSRMTMDKHWASDVFCGALLGHAIGRLVIRQFDRRRRLVPILACSRRGVSLSLVYDLDPAGI